MSGLVQTSVTSKIQINLTPSDGSSPSPLKKQQTIKAFNAAEFAVHALQAGKQHSPSQNLSMANSIQELELTEEDGEAER